MSLAVKLLWERGSVYEREVIEGLEIPFTNLSMCVGDEYVGDEYVGDEYVGDEKERLTLEAMRRGEPLIYCDFLESMTAV